MAHITTLTRAYDDLHNSQANTYSYSGSFETFKESEVKVKLDGTLLTYNSSPSDNTQYSVNLTDKTIHVGGGNLSSGTLSIYPQTDLGDPTLKAPYTAGSAITANDLTNNQKQIMRKLMEHEETKLDNTGGTMTGDLTMGEDRNIIFEGATDNAHETTITVADPTADRTITFPNVSGNVVTTGDTGTVTSTMLTNDTIVNADVNSSAAIAGTKISPNFGGQNIVTTGAATIGSTLAVTGAVDLNGGANIDNIQIGVTDDNEIDTASGNLTIDSAGGTVTVDDALAVTGGVSLNTTLGVTGTSTLADVTGGAVVTSGTSTSDTKVYSAKRAGEIFYGKDTVEEIQSGETWSAADDKVATTAAIDARIIDLVDDVGGFVPIANELSFPNANPDVNNGAGTLVSIKSLSQNLTSSGSGVITISNGTVGNSTVTITGADNSTTYAATYGLIVETTTTLNTYTFHRLTPKATEITSVSGNATNINTVATNITNVNNVGNNIANVNTVAGDTTEINALAAKTTELGLLGTAAVVEDLGILGTADVVSDLNTLGTADVVADMNMLAVSDVISDMNTLAVTDVINDIDTVATNVTNVNNVGGSIASVNTAAANLTSIANFGDQYQVAANNPSTDGGGNALAAGDLYFNTSANELKVYTGSAWQGGVTATGNFAVVTGNTFTGDNRYNDGVKALFGTGSDLEIYHDASNSYVKDNGTGDLRLQTQGGYVSIMYGSHNMALFQPSGFAKLYYDNNPKLETTSTGINVTGVHVDDGATHDGDVTFTGNSYNVLWDKSQDRLEFSDNAKSTFGADADLQIYHTGTNNLIRCESGKQLHIVKGAESATIAKFIPDGAVELYYNGTKTFENQVNHHIMTGNASESNLIFKASNGTDIAAYGHTNSGQMSLYGQPSGGGGYKKYFEGNYGGSSELYYDNSKKFETTSTGAKMQSTGDVSLGIGSTNAGGATILLDGDSNGDFSGNDYATIRHSTDGHLVLHTKNPAEASNVYIQMGINNHYGAMFKEGAESLLRYNNSTKIETTNTGIDVTGNIHLDALPNTTTNSYLKIAIQDTDGTLKSDDTILINPAQDAFRVGGTHIANNHIRASGNGPLHLTTANANGTVDVNIKNTHVEINGNLLPATDSTDNLGSNTVRWANGYFDTLYGDGSNLTGITSTTINNQADNRIITATGTTDTLNAESDLTFDGNTLTHTVGANTHGIKSIAAGDHYTLLQFDSNRASAGEILSLIDFKWDGDKVADIMALTGSDTTNKDDGQLSFRTSPAQGSITERMRITQAGNVGIGTDSPSQSLHVHDTTSYQGIILSGNGAPRIGFANASIGSSGANGGAWSCGIDGTNGDQFVINNSNDNSNRKIILSNTKNTLAQLTQINGNLKFGSSGNGVDFSATSDQGGMSSEVLDDYEEGSWTPSIQDATSGGNTVSSGYIEGKYTKIGNVVTVMLNCRSLSNSGMTGAHQMFVTNLPFRMSGLEQIGVWTQLRYFNNISNTQFGTHWEIQNNQTIMRLQKLADNSGGAQSITYNHWMHSSGYFAFACSFSYITDQ